MARVNIDILGVSELKWPGTGEFSLHDHYIYYAKSLQSFLTLCDPIDGRPPGFAVPGILLQAGTLEWVTTAFSVFRVY